MQEEVKAVESVDEAKDVERKVEIAIELETMVRTKGWNQIFAPWLQSERKAFETGILNAAELKDFLTAQQCINLIDRIFKFVENNIAIGQSEGKRLEE